MLKQKIAQNFLISIVGRVTASAWISILRVYYKRAWFGRIWRL